jgi:LPXTG-motif cell wall-anchored protein
MTRQSTPLRIATGLLLASVALSPAFAQEAQPPTEPAPEAAQSPPAGTTPLLEDTTIAPPVTERTPSGLQASEPVVNTRASGNEPADPAVAVPTRARATTARPAAPRARAQAAAGPRAAPAPQAVRPAPVEAAPVAAPAPALATAAPAAAETPPVAAEPVAAEPAAPAPAAESAPARETGTGNWPWLIAAALAIGALFLFARRRRRVDDQADYVYDEPVVAVAEPAPMPEPPIESVPVAAAAAVETGRPWLDLAIRPVRAGVGEDAARVEFELGVENNGSAPARDVRISTWLLDGSGPAQSEMERMLIERPEGAQEIETSLAPGEGSRIETTVALPRAGLEDAILPVVAAEARYRLPDGSEGRTSASFAVGVARGEDLVMFDVDNPSGMHEGVEARLHGLPRRD